MRIKRSTVHNYTLGVVIVIAASVFVTTFSHAALRSMSDSETELQDPEQAFPIIISTSTPTHSDQPNSTSTTFSSLPNRIIIPNINVDAAIQHTGITHHGTMAVPTNYADAGWYRYGTIPGNVGNAVIAGHLDNGFGFAGVFNRLHELHDGDDIIIQSADGSRQHFTVIALDTYPQDTASTTSIFFNTDGKALIKIITCEGTWDAESETYADRLVLTAAYAYSESTL